MKSFTQTSSGKLLTLSVLSVVIAACGANTDEQEAGGPVIGAPAATPPPVAATPTPAPVPPTGGGNFAGGQFATAFAQETAGTTNANDAVIPGAPLEFEINPDDGGIAAAPRSIGTDVPITHFGPQPSTVNPKFIGPLQLLGGDIDFEAGTITLPLYQGRLASGGPQDGASIWYIITDTSDEESAQALGVNYSAKLGFASIPPAGADDFTNNSVRTAFFDADGTLIYAGGPVDFTPVRSVSSGSSDTSGTNNLLNTLSFTPGAVGANVSDPDGFYSPFVKITNAGNQIYNAPTVSFDTTSDQLSAYCDGISSEQEETARTMLHDNVVAICPSTTPGQPGTVTLGLVNGFSYGRPVTYLSTDASVGIASALEGAILTPALGNIPANRGDSLFSAVEPIFAFTNGPTNEFGEPNPQRQGFNSAIIDGGGPLSVLGGIPTVADNYSPLWDLTIGEWTQEAIDNGFRSRLTEEFAILGMVERGFITGPGGVPYGSVGVLINCPIVHRFL